MRLFPFAPKVARTQNLLLDLSYWPRMELRPAKEPIWLDPDKKCKGDIHLLPAQDLRLQRRRNRKKDIQEQRKNGTFIQGGPNKDRFRCIITSNSSTRPRLSQAQVERSGLQTASL